MPKIPDDVIGVSDAARIIGCTVAWVRRLAMKGHIEGKRIGTGSWVISEASARAYAETEKSVGRPRSRVKQPKNKAKARSASAC